MTPKKTRAAIYTRVSSDESAKKGYSIAGQVERLESFVSANDFALAGAHRYSDEGVSGALKLEQRPALAALAAAAKRREFDVVLVYRLDRLFRSTKLLLACVEEFAETGVGLKSVTEPFDTTSPMGRFMLTTLGSIAELERETIRERASLGRERAMRNGVWFGAPPFGYRKDEATKGLAVCQKEAKIVRRIFEIYLREEESTFGVQRRLNEEGVPSPGEIRGLPTSAEKSSFWHRRTIHRILTNPAYAGELSHTYKLAQSQIGSAAKSGGSQKGSAPQIPRIVAAPTFERVQSLLQRRKGTAKRNQRRPYLFNRRIRCGECGFAWAAQSHLYRRKGGELSVYRYYRCGAYMNGRRRYCGQGSVYEACLEEVLWPKLRELLEEPAVALRALRDRSQAIERDPGHRGKERARLKKKDKNVRTKLQRLNELYVEGILAKDVFNEKRAKLLRDRDAIQAQLNSLDAHRPAQADRSKTVGRFREAPAELDGSHPLLVRYRERLSQLNYEERSFVIHELVSDIVYADGKATVTVLLPSPGLRDRNEHSSHAITSRDPITLHLSVRPRLRNWR